MRYELLKGKTQDGKTHLQETLPTATVTGTDKSSKRCLLVTYFVRIRDLPPFLESFSLFERFFSGCGFRWRG